tara:strand:+ start:4617 stop:4874 length:258 start_codon:yes stop_codon:yes gene_type:complete
MVNNRKCIISGGLFNGYSNVVDLDKTDTLDDIVDQLLHLLSRDLKKLNLNDLADSIISIFFHIHSPETFGEALLSENTIYICNHC